MDNNTQTVVQSFLQHLSERDLTNLTQLFSDNVDWYIPGDEKRVPWLGKRYSREEVSDFYELLWKRTEPVCATIDHIFIDKNDAVITGEFSTKILSSGNVVTSLFCIQICVENGAIVRYRLLEDSYAVSQSIRYFIKQRISKTE